MGKEPQGGIGGARRPFDASIQPRRPLSALPLPDDQAASGRTLGEEELKLLAAVIESGTLTSTRGRYVADLESAAAAAFGSRFAIACSSGTAAIHTAVASLGLEPGEEIITTPVTDMGALTPIIYQAAIPVFADVDPLSGNVTAQTIEARLSERTRAIIATHLFGNPCDMQAIVDLADRRGVPVIEDCAQAFLADAGGRPVGTIGRAGCFSLQQGKHITTGEGGLVVTDDAATARAARLFVNKAWGYGEPDPDHRSLALNYRMSELQGAVGLAQIAKLEAGVRQRQRSVGRLAEAVQEIEGLELLHTREGDRPVFWRLGLLVDGAILPGGVDELAARLRATGVAASPRYIQKPAFECGLFIDRRTFGDSQWPFTLARPEALDYSPDRFPGTYSFLDRVLVLGWNERFELHHADFIGDLLARECAALRGGR